MADDYDYEFLVGIMDRLRGPEGCPWDREQDYSTLRGYLLEECYEVVQALDDGDEDALGEELGDLLFQIVFLSRIAKERGKFTMDDVVRGISEKMVRRHPHVFGDAVADDSEAVLRSWEAIKRRERGGDRSGDEPSLLSGIPAALPALLKAQRLGTKAARVGFDWTTDDDLIAKIREEFDEVQHALRSGGKDAVREEIGDLLFAIVMLARRLDVDPEKALEDTNRKFRSRFEAVERAVRERGVPLDTAGLELLDELWEEAKTRERDG